MLLLFFDGGGGVRLGEKRRREMGKMEGNKWGENEDCFGVKNERERDR